MRITIFALLLSLTSAGQKPSDNRPKPLEEQIGTTEYRIKVLDLLIGDLYREIGNLKSMVNITSDTFAAWSTMNFREEIKQDSLAKEVRILHNALFGGNGWGAGLFIEKSDDYAEFWDLKMKVDSMTKILDKYHDIIYGNVFRGGLLLDEFNNHQRVVMQGNRIKTLEFFVLGNDKYGKEHSILEVLRGADIGVYKLQKQVDSLINVLKNSPPWQPAQPWDRTPAFGEPHIVPVFLHNPKGHPVDLFPIDQPVTGSLTPAEYQRFVSTQTIPFLPPPKPRRKK